MTIKNYNTRSGALWVQPNGPNHPLEFLGCHDLDDLEEPITGGVTPVYKFDPKGRGWITVGRNETPPDPISTTVTGLLFKQKDWLERLNCPFTLFIMKRCGGAANQFNNYERGFAIMNATPITRTYAGLAARAEEAESTVALEINGDIPLIHIDAITIDRLTMAETQNLFGVWTNDNDDCYGDCGPITENGELVYAAADSAAGPATANVPYSDDFGGTFQNTAADPFGAGVGVGALISFWLTPTTRRILAVNETLGAVQGNTAYSDDNGATWTTVPLGGAAAGHGAAKGSALFFLDSTHIWLGTNGGYIYKSTDGGETWTAEEQGAIAVTTYQAIHFSDEYNGIAVTAGDVIVVSSDGGLTWTAAAATGGGNGLLSCFRKNTNHAWVGDDGGQLWYTEDNGATWTERTGSGLNAGDINDIVFANDLTGYLISDTAGPVGDVFRTIDGGQNWVKQTTPTNTGLNDIFLASESLGYVAGNVEGGTAVMLKIHPV